MYPYKRQCWPNVVRTNIFIADRLCSTKSKTENYTNNNTSTKVFVSMNFRVLRFNCSSSLSLYMCLFVCGRGVHMYVWICCSQRYCHACFCCNCCCGFCCCCTFLYVLCCFSSRFKLLQHQPLYKQISVVFVLHSTQSYPAQDGAWIHTVLSQRMKQQAHRSSR